MLSSGTSLNVNMYFQNTCIGRNISKLNIIPSRNILCWLGTYDNK